jgi:hypothetical protein
MSGELSVPTRDIQRKSRGSAFSARVRLKQGSRTPPASFVHCWKETELLRAWDEGAVQAEAAGKVNELFPNLSRGDYLPTDLEEDLEAGFIHGWDSSLHPAGDGERVGRPGQLGRARA